LAKPFDLTLLSIFLNIDDWKTDYSNLIIQHISLEHAHYSIDQISRGIYKTSDEYRSRISLLTLRPFKSPTWDYDPQKSIMMVFFTIALRAKNRHSYSSVCHNLKICEHL